MHRSAYSSTVVHATTDLLQPQKHRDPALSNTRMERALSMTAVQETNQYPCLQFAVIQTFSCPIPSFCGLLSPVLTYPTSSRTLSGYVCASIRRCPAAVLSHPAASFRSLSPGIPVPLVVAQSRATGFTPVRNNQKNFLPDSVFYLTTASLCGILAKLPREKPCQKEATHETGRSGADSALRLLW